MALIKVNVDDTRRSEVLSIIDIFRGKVVDISPSYYTIEVTGDEDKVKAIIELFRPIGIKEIARTGKVALTRESKDRKS
jgi:acetolactate synthase-1/3 small subunit